MSLSIADEVTRPSPFPDGLLTIGDMSRAFKVSQRTLRFYEDRGLLAPRRDGAMRLYGAQERRRLEMILRGKRLGFTLSEIMAMITIKGQNASSFALDRDKIAVQIAHLEGQREGLDRAISELRAAQETLGRP